MFTIGQSVQIYNHSEPQCNNKFGEVTRIDIAYDGYTRYYTVVLDNEGGAHCVCTEDEMMEG